MNKLHYKGDCRKFVPNRIVGPDTWGAWYLPVTAHFFDGITTIFYKPVPPDQLPPQAVAMSKAVVELQQRGRVQAWPHANASLPDRRLPTSSITSPSSPQSGASRKTAGSGGSGLTRSQRKLLKRFKKPGSK